jgi:hypothetical protein
MRLGCCPQRRLGEAPFSVNLASTRVRQPGAASAAHPDRFPARSSTELRQEDGGGAHDRRCVEDHAVTETIERFELRAGERCE